MTASNYMPCLTEVFAREGGYINHPKDPGGPTNYGITLNVLSAHRGHPVTAEDVRKMPKSEAGDIYRPQYWNSISGDSLPTGVDLMVFDYAVNSGPVRAIKALQTALGLRVDGHMGGITYTAAAKADVTDLIAKIAASRLAFLKSLKTFSTFGKGWTTRVTIITAAALHMAGATRTTPQLQDTAPSPGKALDESQKVTSSKTGQGGILAGAGVAGATVTDAANQLSPLGDYSSVIKGMFIVLTVLGIVLTLYATMRKAGSSEEA